MKYQSLSVEQIPTALRLFNEAAGTDMLHKPLNEEIFSQIFLVPKIKGQHNISLIAEDGLSFAAGCYVEAAVPKAYITMVLVDKQHRRKGLGTEILVKLEEQLRAKSELSTIEISFFNPQSFEWIVPHTNGHDHPNTPGVDMQSGYYLFFKNCGYHDGSCQNSYHIALEDYRYPLDIQKKIDQLQEQNISITLYDQQKHIGLQELINSFGNDMWNRDILLEMEKQNPRPLLIVDKEGIAKGFAGPLDVQKSGRGYFAGIGVHEDCRGMGAAKVLFSKLCMSLKSMGATYMTLFTGEANPARNIYEAAGFHIVRSWSVMRKQYKGEKK